MFDNSNVVGRGKRDGLGRVLNVIINYDFATGRTRANYVNCNNTNLVQILCKIYLSQS